MRANRSSRRARCADARRRVRFAPRTKGGRVALDVRSEGLLELVAEDAELEQIGTGFTFTEGPLWHPVDHYLLFSDMPGDVRRRWSESEGVTEVMRPSNKCNGMT